MQNSEKQLLIVVGPTGTCLMEVFGPPLSEYWMMRDGSSNTDSPPSKPMSESLAIKNYASLCKPGMICPAYTDGKFPEACICKQKEDLSAKRVNRFINVAAVFVVLLLIGMCSLPFVALAKFPDYSFSRWLTD